MKGFLVFTSLFIGFFLTDLKAQVILSEDFNGPVLPEYLTYQNEVDLGHEYGVDGSNFFRFHPREQSALLEFPALELNGLFEVRFSYSKNGFYNEDSIVVQVVSGQENTIRRVTAVKNDTERSWEDVVMDLGEISADNVRIQFAFKGSGEYPAPYMGLENIELRQTGTISGIDDLLTEVGLTIAPNPSAGVFSINFESPIDKALLLKVFDVTGKINLENEIVPLTKTHSIDLGFLPNGVYQLSLSDAQNIFSRDIIINK